MSTEESPVRFKYPEEDSYAPIDSIAVFAIFCGLGSTLAILFSPVFVGFGILGLIFGLSALFRIRRSEGTLSGYWVATLGIGLSICCVSAYLTYSSARDAEICARAQELAEDWIKMVQKGEYLEAHQLTKSFYERLLPGTKLKTHYSPKTKLMDTVNPESKSPQFDVAGTPYNQMEDFYAHPIMNVLRRDGTNSTVKFVQVLDRWRKGRFLDYVVLEFEIVFKEDNEPRKDLFAITMMREQYPANFGTHWAVDMIDRKKTLVDRNRQIED